MKRLKRWIKLSLFFGTCTIAWAVLRALTVIWYLLSISTEEEQ